jgi:hypothetical protein
VCGDFSSALYSQFIILYFSWYSPFAVNNLTRISPFGRMLTGFAGLSSSAQSHGTQPFSVNFRVVSWLIEQKKIGGGIIPDAPSCVWRSCAAAHAGGDARATLFFQPGEGALNHPAFRNDGEGVQLIAPGHLDRGVDRGFHCVGEGLPRVTAGVRHALHTAQTGFAAHYRQNGDLAVGDLRRGHRNGRLPSNIRRPLTANH